MTKAQEIEALKKFIGTLPRETYLHEWLTAVLPHVADDIKCDIIPAFTPSARQCARFAKH